VGFVVTVVLYYLAVMAIVVALQTQIFSILLVCIGFLGIKPVIALILLSTRKNRKE